MISKNDYFEHYIGKALDGDGKAGRLLLACAAKHLDGNKEMPDCLRLYLAEVLKAAAGASTSPSQPDSIGRALNITLPIGVSSQDKEYHKAVETLIAVSNSEIARYMKETGVSEKVAHVKLTALKLNISEKTVRRHLKYMENNFRELLSITP